MNKSIDSEKVHIDVTIDAPELIAHVCVRGEWIPRSKVKFIDICEDFNGRDVMTFEFDGQKFESHIIFKHA